MRSRVRSRIDPNRANAPPKERFGRSQIDVIPDEATYPRVPMPELTTHFATADSEGNVVTVTQTLGGGFGSAFAPGGTGVFLNNMGRWFDFDPDCGALTSSARASEWTSAYLRADFFRRTRLS